MKYLIPRNRQIPDPSFADILNSGALVKDKAGAPMGERIFAYRGNDPRLPKAALIPVGKLFPFKFGLIYVPEEAQALREFVAETLRTGATFALWGLSTAAIGALPLPLSAAVYAGIDQALFAERKSGTQPVNNVIADLVKRGAIYLPGVQIVEIEHQIDPGGFLSKKTHRFIVTYERLDGQRASYTFLLVDGPQAQLKVDTLIWIILKSRWMGEFDHLITAVKSAQVNAERIWAAFIEKYQSRYGGNWGKHVNELIAEVTEVLDAELERQGFTPQRGMAEILKRIAPLVPYYRQVPELQNWVRALEEAAGGTPVTL